MIADINSLFSNILAGDRRALSRAITLVESTHLEHRTLANMLLQKLSPYAGNSIRLGVSGIPGAGKSTYIEALGLHIADQNQSLAVLAVDPSSSLNGGSIMADKTRMEDLSRNKNVFIRPSPSSCTLGGVARRTRETLLLCEAAGFDVIIVETVGVGQSETAVAEMTDIFLLLLLPGAGDELQGIKRGIIELADIILVNKADGNMVANANHAASDYLSALKLLQPRTADWVVPVKTCSALNGQGIPQSWQLINKLSDHLKQTEELSSRRAKQAKTWLWSEITDNLISKLRSNSQFDSQIKALESDVISGNKEPSVAALEIINHFWKPIS